MKLASIYPIKLYPHKGSEECAYVGFIGHCHDIDNDFYMRLGGNTDEDALATRKRICDFFNLSVAVYDSTLMSVNKTLKIIHKQHRNDPDALKEALVSAVENSTKGQKVRLGKPYPLAIVTTLPDLIKTQIEKFMIERSEDPIT